MKRRTRLKSECVEASKWTRCLKFYRKTLPARPPLSPPLPPPRSMHPPRFTFRRPFPAEKKNTFFPFLSENLTLPSCNELLQRFVDHIISIHTTRTFSAI